MALRPRSLSVENLESRLNLSSLGGLHIPTISSSMTKAQEKALLARYKVISLTDYTQENTTLASSAKNTLAASTSIINAPDGLTATASTTAVSLKWVDNSSNESGFRVYRSTDGVNFTQVATVARNKTSYTDTTAAAGVTYYYTVAAYNATIQSSLSNVATAARSLPVTTPLAPNAFTATPTATDAISLSWSDNAGNETGYHLYRSTDGTNYTLVGDLAANSTVFTDTGLTSNTKYYYTVAAWNSAGETFAAAPASTSTLAPAPDPTPDPMPDLTPAIIVTAPASPSLSTFTNVTTSSLTLNWSNNASNEDGYRVYRSTDGTTFTKIADLSADATTYADSNLSASTTYYYQVSAWNSAGETLSTSASQTTAAPIVLAPVTPTAISFNSITTSSLSMSWNDNSNNETSFRVYRSTDGTHYTKVADLSAKSIAWSDTGLSASTTYYYKIAAVNSAGESVSAAASLTTAAPIVLAPASPSALSFSNVSSTGLSMSWSDNASNESGYRVYRSTDGTHYTKVADLASNAVAWSDSNLSASTTYYYKIAAVNSGGESLSAAASQTTQAPPVVAPIAPSTLSFASVTTSSLTLNWSDNAANETGYRVYRSTDGTTFSKIADLSAGATTYADSNLSASTKYYYKVSAWNSASEVVSTAASQTTAAPIVLAPTAPTALSFNSITTSSLSMSWNDNSNNETGFRVYRSTDGTNFTKVADLSANSIAWSDTGLSASTTYYYKIAAWNSGGETVSAANSLTTAAPVVLAPTAPTAVSFANITTTSLTLNWNDNSNNETSFRVYRSTDGTNFTKIADLSANAITYADSGLSASTTYFYKVSALNSGGETLSTAASQTTAAPVVLAPAAPTSLSFASVTTTSLTINWADTATNETGYRVYRSTNGTNFTKVADLAAGATTFADSGLTATTTYYYKIAAWNSGGETQSAASSSTTLTPTVVVNNPVSVYTRSMTSFTELVIDGTSSNDSIMVTQSNNVLTITANGQTFTYNNTFGDLMIHGAAGDDTITVDSSVNIATLIYGGDGNNTIVNRTTAKATIVTIGNGVNTVTGNGINTGFWVNTGDTVNATTAEINLGGVNRVASFYQPFTTNASSPDYVPRSLNGQDLRDPTDSGTTKRLTTSSFWGTGPTMNDINQTSLADCYFLAPLSSLAYSEPAKLMNMATDLGDGTYAVRFVRNGTTTYVRVDGDLATGGWNYGLANQMPGTNGNQWGSIIEKAYAFFRSGANTYSSLNYGFQSATFSDLGITNSGITANAGGTTVLNLINSQLNSGHAIAVNTNGSVSGAPVIASHVYSIIGAYTDSTTGTIMIRLRNPWGVDGAGNDGVNDGIVTLTYAQFAANFGSISYATA